MSKKLDEKVKSKLKSYLTDKGVSIDGLTEAEISGLYWEVLSENIEEEEKTTVTSYDLTDDNDSSKFNDELDKTDPEKINVGDGQATIEEEDLVEVDKTQVMKFDLKSGQDVQALQQMLDKGVDSAKLTIGTDGTISLSEEDIRAVMVNSQNPIMSKTELLEEIRNQIISEDNKYEDELNSGDNDYSRNLDPDAVRDMGRDIYNNIRSAAQEKFGTTPNMGSASMAMATSLSNILTFEQNKQQELTELAVKLIREKYPQLTEDVVDIDAQITGHPQLGGRPIVKGQLQTNRGTSPAPQGKSDDELKPEVTKRRIINGMTHGAARKGQNLYHLASDELSRISPNATRDYSKLMASNDFLYWAMDRDTINQQAQGGDHAGNVKVTLDPETRKPKIVAQGMTFPFLLHELTKGVMELMSLHGTSEDDDVRKYVEDKTDTMEAEPDDIRLGVGIWEKVSRFIDVDDGEHEALFYHKLVTLPAEHFNELIKGLLRNDQDSISEIQSIADEASEDLRNERYEDATGGYGEEDEESEVEDTDDEYTDPLLNDLLGGGSSEETSGEPDYENMSRRELQDLMDDALDNGDFEMAKKIGPYLH